MSNPFELNYYSADDVKRLQSAVGIAKKKIWVDTQARRAGVQGSSDAPYDVRLYSCTCRDFEVRQRPCKHMIRLAIELGADFTLPKFDLVAAGKHDVYEDIRPLYERWSAGLITTDAYVTCLAALAKSAEKAKK